MGNDQKIVLLSFQLEDYWFQSHGNIMVRLATLVVKRHV